MFATTAQLDRQLDHIGAAPSVAGSVELVVARPTRGERIILGSAELRKDLRLRGICAVVIGAAR